MRDTGNKKNRKNSGLGLAIWILAVLILIIVFLVKSEDIKANLKKTRFFERLFGKTPAFLAENKSDIEKKSQNDEFKTVIDLNELKKSSGTETENSNIQNDEKFTSKNDFSKNQKKSEEDLTYKKYENLESEKKSKTENEISEKAKKDFENSKEANDKNDENSRKQSETKKIVENSLKSEKSDEKKESNKTAEKTAQAQISATIGTKICFVSIDSDGIVIRKEVGRQVLKDSPLTASINALLSGPTAAELKTGCKTLIPAGTKLNSAVVKNGTALLDFSEEFRFNPNGVEGYLGQFMQIVYTATNFSSVQSVQILIEGQKIDFLDDLPYFRIGVPLSRASFR